MSDGPAARPPRSRWRELRGAFRPTGIVIGGLGAVQVACALIGGGVEWAEGQPEAMRWGETLRFVAVGLSTALAGLGLHAYGARCSPGRLTRREAVLSVMLIWLTCGLFGAVPFVVLAGLGPVDAFFETISGLTTTGATVITDIETRLSRTMLLWRSLISWLGGMGIVVLFVAVFPSIGAGAKHMFKGEVTGTSAEGLKPRIAKTSYVLWRLYTGLTLLQAGLFIACGMDPFEAFCHALTTMSTCGFSTRDGSLAEVANPGVEYVASVFMILGSVNFALFFAVMRHRSLRPLLRSTELRVFFGLLAFGVLATTVCSLHLYDYDVERALRSSFFQVSSCISSTGYFLEESGLYPPPALALLLGLMMIGGCSGSTAGGLKVERVVLLGKLAGREILSAFRPSLVRVVRMGHARIPPGVMSGVAAFFALAVAVTFAGVLIISTVEGVDLPSAFGATLACLAATGAAPWLSPDLASGFHAFSPPGKLVLTAIMLLGRLELFTVFALFVPDFWRR